MTKDALIIKRIVAAFVLSVGFSLLAPLGANAEDAGRIDELFQRLQSATPEESFSIEEQIAGEWARSGSPSIDLLVRRGYEALDSGDFAAAIEHFTAAIDHAPDFAEAYNGRATAFYLSDRVGPALDDIRQTLVLNPRHFGALRGFGAILEELGRTEDALEIYGQVLALSPAAPDMTDAVQRLNETLAGRTL